MFILHFSPKSVFQAAAQRLRRLVFGAQTKDSTKKCVDDYMHYTNGFVLLFLLLLLLLEIDTQNFKLFRCEIICHFVRVHQFLLVGM